MQCYSELTPPTAVTHSVALPLLSARSTDLVVAKTSILQVFGTKSVVSDPGASSSDEVDISLQEAASGINDRSYLSADLSFQRVEHATKLVLIAEYPLSGTILSLKRVKPLRTKSGGDALLVAFRDAKFSLVEWDPEIYSLSTISIHFYEGEGLLHPWAGDFGQYRTFLAVDPGNRCAALKFGPRQLAILPLKQPEEDLQADTDDDLDAGLDGAEPKSASLLRVNTTEVGANERLYNRSFVLPTTALEPTLTHPIHLAFLHEYREPTIGILSCSRFPVASNLHERKDVLNYTVFTLDIDQRASTTILTVADLPFDIFEVIPLTQPVRGALLVGTNQLIHIDQAGKTNGLAVNEFAKQCSSFPMADQSDARLRLEGCTVEPLEDNGDMIIILKSGELAILSFKLDGRSVAGLAVQKVSAECGGTILTSGASCASALARGKIFVGSEDGDSFIVGYAQKRSQLPRKRSFADMLGEDAEFSMDEDDFEEDDIYGDDTETAQERRLSAAPAAADPAGVAFRINDILPNFAPIGDVTFSRHGQARKSSDITEDRADSLELVAPCGRGSGGGVVILNREVDAVVQKALKLSSVRAVWPIHMKKSLPGGVEVNAAGPVKEPKLAAPPQFDSYLVASVVPERGAEESQLYAISATGIDKVAQSDFDESGATVEIGTLARSTRVVQVLAGELRCFDADFGLEQILPLTDDDAEESARVIGASFSDPYLVLLKDDSTISLLETTASGELEEIELTGALASTQWLSACLYQSPAFTGDTTVLFLLTAGGGIRIFELPNLDAAAFSSEGLAYFPSNLAQDFTVRRAAAKETLTEVIVADIGDAVSKSPYLIVRTASNNLVVYQPFHHPEPSLSNRFTQGLRFKKIFQPHLAKYRDEPAFETEISGRETRLRRALNVGGYSTVFQTGTSPCFIFKEASSALRVIDLRSKAVKSFGSFHTVSCSRGFAYLDSDDILRISQLPQNCRYGDTGWIARKVGLGQEVQHIVWYEPKGVYAIATSHKVDFKLPEDDYHYEWASEDTTFLPQVEQSTIKLLDQQTWSIIDSFELEQAEVVMSMKAMDIEVSEVTRQRGERIIVGTAILQGEDLAAKGSIYVLDVVAVVPQPGHPETSRKLKLVAKEDVRGAVTTVSDIGSQGLILFAHGQKAMVRGMKEDGLIPPTAFLDMQTYVTVAKALPGTGMTLLGDAIKGLWLVGYMVSGSCQKYMPRDFAKTRPGGPIQDAGLCQRAQQDGGFGRRPAAMAEKPLPPGRRRRQQHARLPI